MDLVKGAFGRRALVAGLAAGLATPYLSRAEGAIEEIRFVVNAASFVVAVLKVGEISSVFARHGLRPALVVMDSGAAALSALIGGSAPFSVNAPSETVAARTRGQDVLILANLYAGMAASLLFSQDAAAKLGLTRESPLHDRLRALDGQVVAVPSATSAPLGPIRIAAEREGARMRLVYMAQGAMAAALEKGAIAGMIAASPFVEPVLLRGIGTLWINGPGGDLPPDLQLSSSATVQATPATLHDRADTVARLRAAIADTGRFIANDPSMARDTLARSYPQMGEAEIKLGFEQQWRNWTKPSLTLDDVRNDIRLLASAAKIPGLEAINPADVLAP